MKKRLLLTALAICTAVAAWTTVKSAPAPGRLIFPHKFHVTEVGADCATCHADAAKSTDGKQRLIPDMQVCAQCHDVETESGCAKCHSDPTNIVPAPHAGKGYEAFSHALHTAKLDCKACHQVEAGLADSGPLYPNMKACADCHTTNAVRPECNRCHQSGIPAEPASHRVDWKVGHALDARFEADECAMCHNAPGAKQTCNQCHQGAQFGSPHPRNFVHDKAFIRGAGLTDCQTCHEPESFCASCHQQKMVIPSNHSRTGWATARPTKGGLHAIKADADVDNCIICHAALSQQPTCFSAGCHQ